VFRRRWRETAYSRCTSHPFSRVVMTYTKKINKNKTKYVDFVFVWLYNLNIKSENAFSKFCKTKIFCQIWLQLSILLGDRL
ncbi:hypothetical protein ACJBS1_09610, partial [Streptococcus suis]